MVALLLLIISLIVIVAAPAVADTTTEVTAYGVGAGADLDISGGCTPPEGAFACGPRFCDLDLQYCTVTHPGVCCSPPSYHCADLPEACGVTPSCDCVDDDDDFGDSCDCAGDGASGLRVSCYLP